MAGPGSPTHHPGTSSLQVQRRPGRHSASPASRQRPRLKSASGEERPARPARAAGEECTHAGNHHHPPPPTRWGPPASGRTDSRGQDQDQLRRRRLRGLGSVAMPLSARSTILVRPAHIPAPDAPPVTTDGRYRPRPTTGRIAVKQIAGTSPEPQRGIDSAGRRREADVTQAAGRIPSFMCRRCRPHPAGPRRPRRNALRLGRSCRSSEPG